MRHRHGPRKLNITDGAHRRAMMRHIGGALIMHERIRTTLPRAKELRRFIEPLITLAKKPSVHNRRLALARLQERRIVLKLFDELGVRFRARPGGYVRILKHGFRKGDSAPMALVELVDRAPEVAPVAAAEVAKSAAPAAESGAKPSAKASAKSEKTAESEKPPAQSAQPEDKSGGKDAAQSAPEETK